MSIEINSITEVYLEEMMREHRELNPERPIKRDTINALKRYRYEGIEPGGFLTAVLDNDLMGAFARADSYNRATLFQIAQYIYNEMPRQCHGSPENVREWLKTFEYE